MNNIKQISFTSYLKYLRSKRVQLHLLFDLDRSYISKMINSSVPIKQAHIEIFNRNSQDYLYLEDSELVEYYSKLYEIFEFALEGKTSLFIEKLKLVNQIDRIEQSQLVIFKSYLNSLFSIIDLSIDQRIATLRTFIEYEYMLSNDVLCDLYLKLSTYLKENHDEEADKYLKIAYRINSISEPVIAYRFYISARNNFFDQNYTSAIHNSNSALEIAKIIESDYLVFQSSQIISICLGITDNYDMSKNILDEITKNKKIDSKYLEQIIEYNIMWVKFLSKDSYNETLKSYIKKLYESNDHPAISLYIACGFMIKGIKSEAMKYLRVAKKRLKSNTDNYSFKVFEITKEYIKYKKLSKEDGEKLMNILNKLAISDIFN